mmetsp:Transcript_20261/g.36767  ORF Transcript_20261/g.36767 Transcript_20261/m.36767 type:complete len:181 (-) Transcript_20261:116-658(-)
MIQSQPHDESVDMWTMGVLLYELTTGQAPFHSACKETTFRMITTVEIRFPSELDSIVQDLILKLCQAEGPRRLKVREAMRHPFVAPLARPQQEALPLENLQGEGMDVGARGLLKERERMMAEKENMVRQLGASQSKLQQAKDELALVKRELEQEQKDRVRIEGECRALQSKLDGLKQQLK